MKLKKNDLYELTKSGQKAITAKVVELRSLLASHQLEKKGSAKMTRRSLAQLLTVMRKMQ